MFERQSLLQNRGCRRRIDQRQLLLGLLPTLRQPSRGGHGRQPLVHQSHWNIDRTGQSSRPRPSRRRGRTLAPAQAAREPDEHLDRLVLANNGYKISDLFYPGANSAHRIGQDPISVACRHPDPHIPPIER
jgi:hypothetical protein